MVGLTRRPGIISCVQGHFVNNGKRPGVSQSFRTYWAWLMVSISFLLGSAAAHTVDYQIDNQKVVVVTVRLAGEPARFAEFEVFEPGTRETPFQTGQTDARGKLSFVPTQAGTWIVKVAADSHHGLHGQEMKLEVTQDMIVKSDSRPLVATHTRLIVGISVLFGLFGLVSLTRARRRQADKP
jgi:nickel transport protein